MWTCGVGVGGTYIALDGHRTTFDIGGGPCGKHSGGVLGGVVCHVVTCVAVVGTRSGPTMGGVPPVVIAIKVAV